MSEGNTHISKTTSQNVMETSKKVVSSEVGLGEEVWEQVEDISIWIFRWIFFTDPAELVNKLGKMREKINKKED